MRLRWFILQRLVSAVFILFSLSLIMFTIARVIPGDPARLVLGPRATESMVQKFREEYHLNEPFFVQYYFWLQDLFRGSFGQSLFTKRDVVTDIIKYVPVTLELVLFASVIQVISSITLGVLSGRNAKTWIDNIVRIFAYIGIAVPPFVFGIIFLLTLGFTLNSFPLGGRISDGIPYPSVVTGLVTIDALIAGNYVAFGDAIWHLFLPALSLCLGNVAQESRIIRANIIENLNQDYTVSAVSHGIPERVIMLKYILKPSLSSAIPIMGLDIANLMVNAFLIELIFNWPGFSRYAIQSILHKDLNSIVAVVLVIGLIFVLVNIVADVIVGYLDPRIRILEEAHAK